MEMVLPSAQSRLAPAGRAAPTAAAEASAPYAIAMVGASSASADSADGRCERADMVVSSGLAGRLEAVVSGLASWAWSR